MIAGDPLRNTLQRRTISYLRAVYTVYSGDVASIAPSPTPWNQVVMLSDFHFFQPIRECVLLIENGLERDNNAWEDHILYDNGYGNADFLHFIVYNTLFDLLYLGEKWMK